MYAVDKGKNTKNVASLTSKQLSEQHAYFCITVPQTSFCFNIKTINSHMLLRVTHGDHEWFTLGGCAV